MIPNRADEKIAVKYVLYSHYSKTEKDDFQKWIDKTPTRELPGVKFLLDHARSLRELLTSPAHEGLAVLFYASGLPECFDGIEEGKSRQQLLDDHATLRFAEAVSSCVSREFDTDAELSRRIRFVTALDLYDIFGRVNALDAEHLRWWFIGATSDIHYDTPKIVEAIVRLRLLGNGVPVFRLDWDVMFNDEDSGDPGLFKAVAICLRAYRLRLEDPTVATFLFSASYDTRRLKDDSLTTDFKDWRGAFATRVFPALPIIPELVQKVTRGDISWEEYAIQTFDEELARRFYGLRPQGLHGDGAHGLVQIGAHPLVSVISGAFLCLSDGAILDLPPFSNFSFNVSWIDDHLKYCLHRELRHLTSVDLRLSEPSLSDAKLDEVVVTKARSPIKNLPHYTLVDYIPALLWGAIVDAWINPDPLLKCRPDHMSDEERDRWLNLPRHGRSSALLPSHLQSALETGRYTTGDRVKLKKALIREGLARITAVRGLWAQLTGSGHETFASIWAKGTVSSYFPGLPGKGYGVAPETPLTTPIAEEAQLNAFLRGDFEQVCEDRATPNATPFRRGTTPKVVEGSCFALLFKWMP